MESKRISQSNLLSKECIVSALLQLIKTKPLTAINISELCQKAGVSRMTFYRNYDSCEDIFIKHLDEIFEDYEKEDFNMIKSDIFCDEQHMNHYFNYIYLNHEFLDGLISCGFDVIFLNKLNIYVLSKWKGKYDTLLLTAFVGSLYNMFHLWSTEKYELDKEMMIKTLVNLYAK